MMQTMQGQRFTEDSRRQAVEELQKASKKLQDSSDPSEQARWALQVRHHADRIASFSGDSKTQRTVLSIDAELPSSEAFHELEKLGTETPGIKEVSWRRGEGGTPRVRIQTTYECLPQIEEVLRRVGRTLSGTYSGSSYSGSSGG